MTAAELHSDDGRETANCAARTREGGSCAWDEGVSRAPETMSSLIPPGQSLTTPGQPDPRLMRPSPFLRDKIASGRGERDRESARPSGIPNRLRGVGSLAQRGASDGIAESVGRRHKKSVGGTCKTSSVWRVEDAHRASYHLPQNSFVSATVVGEGRTQPRTVRMCNQSSDAQLT